MQEIFITAMIIGLLRTIFILVVIYYGFKLLVRYVFPYFLKNYVQKEMNRNKKQYRDDSRQRTGKEGAVNIDYVPEKKKKIAKNEGDYVDYEEVKD